MTKCGLCLRLLIIAIITFEFTYSATTTNIIGACTVFSTDLKRCTIEVTFDGAMPTDYTLDMVRDVTGLVYVPVVPPVMNFSLIQYTAADYQYMSDYSDVFSTVSGNCALDLTGVNLTASVAGMSNDTNSLGYVLANSCPYAGEFGNWLDPSPSTATPLFPTQTSLLPYLASCQQFGLWDATLKSGYCLLGGVKVGDGHAWKRYVNIKDRSEAYYSVSMSVGTTSFDSEIVFPGCDTIDGIKICGTVNSIPQDSVYFPDLFVNKSSLADVFRLPDTIYNDYSYQKFFYDTCDWKDFYYGSCARAVEIITGAPSGGVSQYTINALNSNYEIQMEFCRRSSLGCATTASMRTTVSTVPVLPIATHAIPLTEDYPDVEFVTSASESHMNLGIRVLNITKPVTGKFSVTFVDYVKVAGVIIKSFSAARQCIQLRTAVTLVNDGNEGFANITLVHTDNTIDIREVNVLPGISAQYFASMDVKKVCIRDACALLPNVVCELPPPPVSEPELGAEKDKDESKSSSRYKMFDPENELQFTFELIGLVAGGVLATILGVVIFGKIKNMRARRGYSLGNSVELTGLKPKPSSSSKESKYFV